MGAETPGQAAYEDGLRAKLAEVTREHALLVRYLGPSATQAALSGLEPRDVVLDEAAPEPKPAPVGPGRAAWLKSVELWGPGHAATFDDLSDLERGQWSSIAQAGMDGSEYVRELERRAAQEPHAAPELDREQFIAAAEEHLATRQPRPTDTAEQPAPELADITADRDRYAEALQRIVDAVGAGDAAAVDKLARNALGLTRTGRPAPFQPEPDLEVAFANGMRVRTGLCAVEAHDREHFQVRTNGHWLCGHLLASVLTAQGIVAGTEAQPANELADALGDWPAILADVTQQRDDLRELLDEVGVLAANAPEDDGSFAVCEQIAMRIAAADMPAEPVPGDVLVTPGDGTPIGGLLAHVGVEAHAAPELAEPVTVAGVLCRDYPSVVAAMQAEIDRRRVVFLRVEGERDQLREAHERQRLELAQARGEAAETSAELTRVKQLHAGLLGEVKPNGGGYTFRTTGVLLARRYAAANLPLRDDLSKLAGQ